MEQTLALKMCCLVHAHLALVQARQRGCVAAAHDGVRDLLRHLLRAQLHLPACATATACVTWKPGETVRMPR